MASRNVKSLIVVLSVLLLTSSFANAEQFTAGTGLNSAEMYIEWSDGYSAQFLVNFGATVGETVTGLGLLDIVEASTSLTTVRLYEGAFIDGISFNEHSNSGYDGGANWWHYWVKDSTDTEWLSPAFGAGDRTVSDGDSDGWIYGRDTTVPEPVSIMLLGLGGMLLRSFGRKGFAG